MIMKKQILKSIKTTELAGLSPQPSSPVSSKSLPQNSEQKSSLFQKIQLFLLLWLPGCLFFSFHPVLTLAKTSTTNFELSLPLLWLICFTLVSLPDCFIFFKNTFWKKSKESASGVTRSFKVIRLNTTQFKFFSLIFPIYATISVVWSKNSLRGFLTAGVIWCLCLSLLTFIKNIVLYKKQLGKQIERNLLISSLAIAGFCWFQSVLDVLGVTPDKTLLCLGCTSQTFGFPHPNGFAIEPQFMANLLLAPIFLSLSSLFSNYSTKKNQSCLFKFSWYLISFSLIATLYLTLSRGAIFSFWVGAFALFLLKIIAVIKSQTTLKTFIRKIILQLSLVILPLVFTLIMQGFFTAIGPTHLSFFDGVSTSLSQLSLGRINLRTSEQNNIKHGPLPQTSQPQDINQTQTSQTQNPQIAPQFTGYIAESTSIRLKLNEMAIDSWNDSVNQIFFGVGLGSTGVNLYQKFPELGSPKEIIQNEYLALLYEQGVLGVIAFCLTVASLAIIYILYNKNPVKSSLSKTKATHRTEQNTSSSFLESKKAHVLILYLVYALTLCFFSGLPNALHIYLLPPLLFSL